MATDVRVPTTGNSGEDVVVAGWAAAVGSRVEQGDVLATLETAKAVIEVEAPTSGTLLSILHDEGDEVGEHEVLAVIGEPGEATAPSEHPSAAPPAASAESAASPQESPPAGPATRAPAPSRTRIAASPRARVLAERRGIDLGALRGSGPGGRVIVGDVLAATATPTVLTSEAAPAEEGDVEIVPVRGARRITAQRMYDSLQQSAQVTLTRYADASALLGYAARLKEITEARGLSRIGVNELVLLATARVLARHPEANSTFDWDGIRRFRRVNLGFAVDTGQALLVPVVRDADRLRLRELAQRVRELVDAARGGGLAAEQMEGGTFTVSNLGSLGVHWFTPVLNPPQSGILGVGAVHRDHPDAPALLPLSYTFDHRAIDGAAAARVLADLADELAAIDVLAAL